LGHKLEVGERRSLAHHYTLTTAGMVRVWVAGKTCVIPLLHTGHI